MARGSVAIIGGGAAGLMTAVLLNGATVYDKNAKLGKKILVTGNGRCNLTNANLTADCYNHPDFVSRYLDKYGYDYQRELFEKLGILLRVDDEGRLYPITNSARTVQDVLISNADCIFDSNQVHRIERDEVGYTVVTDSGRYHHDIVVVATGGGSDILDSFGIKKITPRASLVPLECLERYKSLDGVRVKCLATLYRDGEQIYRERGEVLFRKYGLSGICVMNMSAHIARDTEAKYRISLDILPDISLDTLTDMLSSRRADTALYALDGITVRSLSEVILCRAGVGVDDYESFVNRAREVAISLKSFDFTVRGTRPIEEGQVVSGGYSIDEVEDDLSISSMPNMYIIGEALDIDGLCGGYNLAWAWISASIVADSINAKI